MMRTIPPTGPIGAARRAIIDNVSSSGRVVHDSLRQDQVRAHAGYVHLAAAGMALVITSLGVALWPVANHWTLTLWLGSLALPFVARVVLARAYQRDPGAWSADAWVRGFRATFVVHGLAWASAVLLFGDLDTAYRTLLAFIMVGVTSSALNTSAFDRVAGLLVLVIAVAPWSLRMLLEGGRLHVTMGAMLALHLAYMAAIGAKIHRHYVANVALRRATETRAETLAAFQEAFARLWQVDQGDAAEFVRMATRDVAAAMHLTRACLFWFDQDGDVAVLSAAAGDRPPADAGVATARLSSLSGYLAALSSAGRLSTDGAAPLPAHAETTGTWLAPTPGQARLDVPLGGAGHVRGVLCCERPAGPWTQDEETFVLAAAATLQAATEESRRRDAEQRLRDLNQNLEQLVEARTSALQQSEARLAQALDATNDGLWDFDRATGSVYYSPVLARLLGYAAEELPQTLDFFRQQIHPDGLGRLRTAMGEHVAGRVPAMEVEIQLRTKSGDWRWFLTHGKIVQRAADGTPLRVLGTISDVTERRRAVEDLHESELRFRALFDKSPVIVTLIDLAESRIAEMNEVGLRTFGYTRDEVLGRTTLELGLWADEHERRHAARRLIDTGLVSGLELQLRRKGGEQFWALLSSTLVTFQGEPFALTTLQDITERRQLEARVLQSQKMEVVGHLAGGVAHDFNNVLTVITSTAELAMSGTRDGDPMYEALQTIRAASTRAARLTGQLLAFSRRQILQPAPLDLNELMGGLAPMIRRVVGDAVVLDLRGASSAVTVVADRGSLEQVVLNLAINARDAMPDGGTLTVSVRAAAIDTAGAAGTTLAPGTYATLSVTDTGTGMTDAVRQRLFEPFFTTKDVGRGTGLGLSMAHGVVQQSGGDILVRSVLGEGSSFTICLPLTAEAPVRVTQPPRQVTGGSETVLVVDDDPDIREVLRRALTFAGYQVALAANGEEALAELQRRQGAVDLVLTDVMMPGIGGRELAERVRAGHPSARILFTSGYAENAIAHHGVLADGVQFIAKPYSLQALTTKVREVLDR